MFNNCGNDMFLIILLLCCCGGRDNGCGCYDKRKRSEKLKLQMRTPLRQVTEREFFRALVLKNACVALPRVVYYISICISFA